MYLAVLSGPMLGAASALILAVAAIGTGIALFGRFMSDLDPAERMGVAGLLGAGVLGMATFFLGLLPFGLAWGLPALGAALAVGFIVGQPWKNLKVSKPEGWALGAAALVGLLFLIGLIGALAPSTSVDWDSLAYHMAVPKRWLDAGQISYVPALHQSNFPQGVDSLYIWGLAFGGETGAKSMTWALTLLGCLAIFGLARRWGGATAGWTALIGFAGIPVVAWEAGTAYVDSIHGVYAALAAAYTLDALTGEEEGSRCASIMAALMLAFCLGSKLTGLQVAAGIGALILVGGFALKDWPKAGKVLATVCFGGALIASPWYIRTAINTGNPVFPFFYSIFKAREWDQWRADLYAGEQASFGVGKSPEKLGHAVLGLAYEPGRYVNPMQTEGGGFPSGALGFGVLFAVGAAIMATRLTLKEKLLLGYVAFGLLLWFVLSQQSRYLTVLAIPAVLAAAAAGSRIKAPIVQAGFAIQGILTLAILYQFSTSDQLPVALGRIDREAWREGRVPFAKAAKELNGLPAGSKIALYDEVFGFLVNHQTMWANPGHSTLIKHESSKTGADLAASFRELGITHVYVSTAYQSREDSQRWLEATGAAPGEPYSEEEKQALWKDLNLKWRWLLADGVRSGDLIPLTSVGRGLILQVKTE